MTNEEAWKILLDMGAMYFPEREELFIYGNGQDVTYRVGWDRASLAQDFTADQLEAIAMWMRDPAGVMG